MEHDIGLGLVWPIHSLNAQHQTFDINILRRVLADRGLSGACRMNGNSALLNQAGANAARAESLRIENVLKLHEIRRYRCKAKRPPTVLVGGRFGL